MTRSSPLPSAEAARRFIDEAGFVWHQQFELVPGVWTPGSANIEWLLERSGLADRLDGLTILDIGASNAGAAFIAERRGAERIVAVDIYPAEWFGVDQLKSFLDSGVEYVQASVYELPRLIDETFDVVLFFGVLYHLRHPLLALDAVRSVARGEVYVETAVADHEIEAGRDLPLARFYRRDELGGDPSNWFAPTVAALADWCASSGLEPELVDAWPADAPVRAIVRARRTDGEPEFAQISYERRLLALPADERLDGP